MTNENQQEVVSENEIISNEVEFVEGVVIEIDPGTEVTTVNEVEVLEGELISDAPVFQPPVNEIGVTEVDFTNTQEAAAFESVPDLLSLTFATGKDNVNTPILSVTAEGEFQWAPDALTRFETDDFTNYMSIKHTLLALWSVKGPTT